MRDSGINEVNSRKGGLGFGGIVDRGSGHSEDLGSEVRASQPVMVLHNAIVRAILSTMMDFVEDEKSDLFDDKTLSTLQRLIPEVQTLRISQCPCVNRLSRICAVITRTSCSSNSLDHCAVSHRSTPISPQYPLTRSGV